MSSSHSPVPGQLLPVDRLVNVPRLITAYYSLTPDTAVKAQKVSFGTSGHRGSALLASFNEHHILAITQAVCEYRARENVTGPLFLGVDTHALSEPAFVSALEVLAANGVETLIAPDGGYTPTPVISHAILTYNRGRASGLADGIVISPSHNPPEDGGFKYNPTHGGPADVDATGWIQDRANDLLAAGLAGVSRTPYARARAASCVRTHDFITPYVTDLASVVDMETIRAAGVRIGIDPLGGAGVQYWAPIIERYGLDATIVNTAIDPTFRFVPADWDGKVRMDCSSPHAMTGLIALGERFDIAFGNDTDADRHGIVCPSSGLMNPNHYLAAAIAYLCSHRPDWPAGAAIGKTVVSSSMIDRVVKQAGRGLYEVPVGIKWFTPGLVNGSLAFGGEESAGATFLRRDGSVWTTDKDGLIMGLLAAEICARTGQDPARYYDTVTADLGRASYARMDAAATPAQKDRLKKLNPDQFTATSLAGEPVIDRSVAAPGNKESIGGLKVTTANGWFAARPSGTEDVYKIYAESFLGEDHLALIQKDAKAAVDAVLAGA